MSEFILEQFLREVDAYKENGIIKPGPQSCSHLSSLHDYVEVEYERFYLNFILTLIYKFSNYEERYGAKLYRSNNEIEFNLIREIGAENELSKNQKNMLLNIFDKLIKHMTVKPEREIQLKDKVVEMYFNRFLKRYYDSLIETISVYEIPIIKITFPDGSIMTSPGLYRYTTLNQSWYCLESHKYASFNKYKKHIKPFAIKSPNSLLYQILSEINSEGLLKYIQKTLSVCVSESFQFVPSIKYYGPGNVLV